jgi:hypothetical protein
MKTYFVKIETMNDIKKIALFFFIFLLPITLYSSNIVVKASIDSTRILIGNQANLKLSVSKPENEIVSFPILADSISKKIDVVARGKCDTTKLGNNRIQITQNYTITSFDSGAYAIPPFVFRLKNENDTLQTNSLALRVLTLKIDTTKQNLRDIKPVLSFPFSWADFFKNALIILLILLVVAALVYVIIRLVKKKPIISRREAPLLPPHVYALTELEKIKNEKLWQKGREKEFHTQITDVLRIYIEDRFGINAMEMTSDEILENISKCSDSQSVFESLKQILKTADLVKFAKMTLPPNENELSIINGYLFVNQTKIEEQQPTAKVVNNETEKEETAS